MCLISAPTGRIYALEAPSFTGEPQSRVSFFSLPARVSTDLRDALRIGARPAQRPLQMYHYSSLSVPHSFLIWTVQVPWQRPWRASGLPAERTSVNTSESRINLQVAMRPDSTLSRSRQNPSQHKRDRLVTNLVTNPRSRGQPSCGSSLICCFVLNIGSGGRDRTYDQLINSQLLYR